MRTSRFGMFAALLALTAAPALAHGPGRGGACRTDIAALCPDVTPGPGAYRSCLATLCSDLPPGPSAFGSCLQHAAMSKNYTLSDQCAAELAAMQAKMDTWKAACVDSGDVANFCSGVTGPREIGKCLHQAVTDGKPVSQDCQALLAQHHRHHHHHQQDPNSAPASE